eukprot:507789-Pleurochrysis_carterae.AAC.1
MPRKRKGPVLDAGASVHAVAALRRLERSMCDGCLLSVAFGAHIKRKQRGALHARARARARTQRTRTNVHTYEHARANVCVRRRARIHA